MFLYQEWYLQIYAPSIHHLLPLRLPVWGDLLDDGCVATSLLQKSVVPQLTALTLNTENMRSACMAEDLEKATRNKDKTLVVMVGAWSLEVFKGCVLERLDWRERERTGFWKSIVALVMELVYSCIRLDLRHHNFTLTQHRLTRYIYIYVIIDDSICK